MPRPKPVIPRVQTTIRLREDLRSKIANEAAMRGVSKTYLIEKLIAQFLRSQGYKIGGAKNDALD